MRKIILGRTNAKVSAISLGTWAFGGENMSGSIPVGWSGQTDKNSRSVLMKAYESGINHWDTADVYGDGRSEKIIGEMWETVPRNDIFIATKVGWDKGPHKNWYEKSHMVKNMNRSLKNLNSDYVDAIYLHHCNFGKEGEYFDEAFDTIKRFQSEGKARFIGLSDWSSTKIMQYIKKCDPDMIQPYRNVMDDDYKASGLKEHVDENNLGVCFFSPLKHGLLTGKYNSPPVFEHGDHRSKIRDFLDSKVLKTMRKNKGLLEKRFSKCLSPVAFGVVNALFNDSPTGCVLLGQRNIDQVLIAASLGDLISDEDSAWVKSLYKE